MDDDHNKRIFRGVIERDLRGWSEISDRVGTMTPYVPGPGRTLSGKAPESALNVAARFFGYADIADAVTNGGALGGKTSVDLALVLARFAQDEMKPVANALRELIYEITHLCPLEDDGSHRPVISAEVLERARRTYRERVAE
jgi:hypothetical protein